ncbi:MAG: phytoene desaturase family protein [Candidatus Electrothrix sp. YB6]
MISRRDFLWISGMASAAALMNWQCPAWAKGGSTNGDKYDVIIIGAGLGGLSCAAWLVQSGYRPLVIDQRDKVGGYATSFQRDGFTCEVSLHGITGSPVTLNVLNQLFGPNLNNVLIPHEYSWNALYPYNPVPDFSSDTPDGISELDPNGLAACYRNGLALDFPTGMPGGATGIQQMTDMLLPMFPEESTQLARYMANWEILLSEIGQFYAEVPENGMPPLDAFFRSYPTWARMIGKTLADHMSEYGIRNQKLRGILSQSWGYYGLPPSQLPAWFYLWTTGWYHNYGKFYIRGTSQTLSDALAGLVMQAGGGILLDTEVKEIILENGKAVGVKTEDNAYYSKAVVSNASVLQTFGRLLPESEVPSKYTKQINRYRPSISHTSVWLGLNQDISYDIHQSDLFIYPDYDPEKTYKASMRRGNPYGAGIALMNYDRLIEGFSPKGKSLISLMLLSGYEPWQKYEQEYFSGDKERYYRRKEHVTRDIIRMAEQSVLPGLSDMIIMEESSTPLTNVRFTGNTQGAIYGFEQIRDNSGFKRIGNRSPIEGLYLSGAWTYPGGSFELVMLSGKEALKCMVEDGVLG